MHDTTSTGFFFDEKAVTSSLHSDLKRMVRLHSMSHPRGHQRSLGPSEVGHPCMRKMVQSLVFGSGKTASGEVINPPGDVLPSYVGVAAHRQLEEAVSLDNANLEACGQTARWISEKKVVVREDLSGTCDLYDRDTRTVIDFKFPGPTAMTRYRKEGPSPEYRTQAHLYGAGYIREGLPVERVGIWFLPRAGTLTSSHLWTEEYSDEVVDEALSRIDLAHSIIRSLEINTYAKRLRFVPTTPHSCQWCPYFTPVDSDDPSACRGDS